MHPFFRLAVVALTLGPAWAWLPLPTQVRRLQPHMAKKKGAAKPKAASTSKAGFGAKAPAEKDAPKGVGTGIKSLKKQYALFVELQKEGAKVFDVVVRNSEKKGDWVKVGSVCSQGDDAHAAVQVQLSLILEHAQVVRPAFQLVKTALQAGWRAEPAAEEGDTEGETGGVPDADVTPLERKAIPQGSVKAGYKNLIPIAAPAMKAAI